MSSSAASRLRLVLVAALLGGAIAAPTAHAGTYDVVACDAAGGANNSWVAYIGNSLGTTAYTTCPTGGDPWRGIIARSVVQQNGGASVNVVAQQKFTAAPGTTIIGLNAAYDFYRGDAQWEAALSTGSVLLKGCPIGGINGCAFSSAGQWIDVPGGSPVIYIDVYCVTNGCPLDSGDAAHNYVSAYARLASASVRLQDDSAPAINAVGGGLWSDGWKSGAQSLTIDASDNSGVRRTVVLLDGQQLTAGNRTCDATQVVPCPNGVDTFPLSTAPIADGQHQLTVQAIDSAGNPASGSRTILVDNSPPGAAAEACRGRWGGLAVEEQLRSALGQSRVGGRSDGGRQLANLSGGGHADVRVGQQGRRDGRDAQRADGAQGRRLDDEALAARRRWEQHP